MLSKFFMKRELKKTEIEQKRREEFEKLREKQNENEIFTAKIRDSLNELQRTFKEYEEIEKKNNLAFKELELKTEQIDILKSRSPKFIFKIIDEWKIIKITRQREKQKQNIEESENAIGEKKEEIRKSIYNLLDSFEHH